MPPHDLLQQLDVGPQTDFSEFKRRVTVIPKITSVLLIGVLMATSSGPLFADEAAQQNVSEMRTVANRAVEKSKQVNVVLRAKRDGKKKMTGRPAKFPSKGSS